MRLFRKDWGGIALFAALALVALPEPVNAAGTVPLKAIEHAIGKLDCKRDDAAFTKAGKPRVKHLEAILGEDISAKERDAAWASYKAPKAPTCDNTAVQTLKAEIKTLKGHLKAAGARAHSASMELSIRTKERNEALAANTEIERKALRDVEAARNSAARVKAHYNRLMGDAEVARATALRTKAEAEATLAEAIKREKGAGPSSSRSCRKALSDNLLDAGTGWFSSSVSVDKVARKAIRVACME